MCRITNLPVSCLRILFQVKNECIAIDKFGVLSDVNSSQRAVTCDHDTLQGDGTYKKELQSFYDGNTLTLCDNSAKTLSVSTASSLTGQWKMRKSANRKVFRTRLRARWTIISFLFHPSLSTPEVTSTRQLRFVNHVYVSSSRLGCSRAFL